MKTRRMFLKDGALCAAALALVKCSKPAEGPFTREERLCIIAMADQIVPQDSYAGATDAGAINYIENFAGVYYPEILPFYKSGLAAFQKSARRMHGKDFCELDFDTKKALMQKMEKGELDKSDWQGLNQISFFNEILQRTMQGFYGPPTHGGNKNQVSYRMLKFNMPIVTGQNRYKGDAQNG